GDAINFTRRLLDSERLHTWLTETRQDLVLMVSEQIYSQVIKQGHSNCDPAQLQRVRVRHRQVRATAWVLPRKRQQLRPLQTLAAGWQWGREAGRRIREAAVDRLRRRVWRVPLWALLSPVLALVIAVGVVIGGVIQSPADPCGVPTELPVVTSPTNEALWRQLGDMFTDNLKGPGGRCRAGNVTVFSVPSSSDVTDAIAAGWSSDSVSRYGPEPSVWIPDSGAEVNRVNERLAGQELHPLGSVATSPLVLAMPPSDAARAGLGRSSTWTAIRDVGQPADNPRVRIARSDPTSTATALLGTVGLYSTVRDTDDRRAIEQMLAPVVGDDESGGLCTIGQRDRNSVLGGGEPPGAVITSERLMVARNRGKLGGSCGGQTFGPDDGLEAIYPSDRTPFLDYPYMLLKAAFEDDERKELALEFFRFLRSDPEARKMLCEAGFRNVNHQVCGTVNQQDGVFPPASFTPLPPPSGKAVESYLDQWDAARRAAFTLLVLDVSGAMRDRLPNQPGADRMTAAREAARGAVRLMGSRDHIGLWQFATRLDGERDYRELVPLGPVDARRQPVLDALAHIRATSRHAGLYDTIVAGVAHLDDKGGGADDVNAMIVVTDGKDDDPAGGATLDDVVDRLRAKSRVHVFLLALEPSACGSPSLTVLTDRTAAVCLDAGESGLDRAFRQVSATLWGTEGP
ncbi:MAG TPA: substrate-binding domain-containing protein, partial [Actinomycetes bacterium]|nr:substrate-binding domain-containing protein [Actinomycetes bacterium]